MMHKSIPFFLIIIVCIAHDPLVLAMGAPSKIPHELTPVDTALFYAVSSRDESEIKRLIAEGANLNAQSKMFKDTPLHEAVDRGAGTEIIEALITPQNINMGQIRGLTPLHLAAEKNNINAVRTLVQNGANKNALDKLGETPLHVALKKKIVELPLIDVKVQRKTDINVIRELISPQNINLLSSPQLSQSPLLEALDSNEPIDIIKLLISEGADKNALNAYGTSPLTQAISKEADINIIKELITPQNINLLSTTVQSDSPLMTALNMDSSNDQKRIAIIKLLIDSGADKNTLNKHGESPLHVALRKKIDINIIKELITPQNINIRSATKLTPTPLTEAILNKSSLEVIRLLLDSGAKITQYDWFKALDNQELLKTLITHVTPEEVQHIIPSILSLKEASKTIQKALNRDVQRIIKNQMIKDVIDEKLALAHKYKLKVSDDELINVILTNMRRELSKKKVVL